jgi:hypothetical protein
MNLGSNRCCTFPLNVIAYGSEGDKGKPGPIGSIGNTGSTGAQGPQGEPGLCYRGYKGDKGLIGPQGSLIGDSGPVGPVGPIGPVTQENRNFSFIIANNTPISNTYIDLIANADPPLQITNYNIPLSNLKYAISWEISESWSDPNNKLYIKFTKNDNTVFLPHVYQPNHPAIVNTNNSCIGNDLLDLTSESSSHIYTIGIIQDNNIDISGQTVKFSITFVPIS